MQQTEQAVRALFGLEEAATYLGVGRTQMYELLRSDEIPSMKIGRLRKVRVVDLDSYIAERLREAQQKR
jgi:excisionase family DNA binding protein